jgi:2-iminobutanoate/2-iminopropanoate deaminase
VYAQGIKIEQSKIKNKNMKIIHTDNAPHAVGPYSQAITYNGLLFLSGQLGLDPSTMILPLDVATQTHQIFYNIQAILAAAGKDLTNVIKTTVFLVDMEDFAQVNSIYAHYFGNHKPARSCVAVKQLPKNALIEIECIVG